MVSHGLSPIAADRAQRSPRSSSQSWSRGRSYQRSHTGSNQSRANSTRPHSRSVSRSRDSVSQPPARDLSRRDSASPSRNSHWRRSPSSVPNTKIVVERLTKNVNESHLQEIFGQFGRIQDLDLPISRISGTNRGTAYILFTNEADAEAAIAYMHESQLDGTTINVSIVLPRRKFSPSPPLARRVASFNPRNNIPPSIPTLSGPRGGRNRFGNSRNFDTYRPRSQSRSRSRSRGDSRRRYRSRSFQSGSRSRSRSQSRSVTPPQRDGRNNLPGGKDLGFGKSGELATTTAAISIVSGPVTAGGWSKRYSGVDGDAGDDGDSGRGLDMDVDAGSEGDRDWGENPPRRSYTYDSQGQQEFSPSHSRSRD